jgi:hypothetical protein
VPRVCFPLQVRPDRPAEYRGRPAAVEATDVSARCEAGMAAFVDPPRRRDGRDTSALHRVLDLDAQPAALSPAVPAATAPNGETP